MPIRDNVELVRLVKEATTTSRQLYRLLETIRFDSNVSSDNYSKEAKEVLLELDDEIDELSNIWEG